MAELFPAKSQPFSQVTMIIIISFFFIRTSKIRIVHDFSSRYFGFQILKIPHLKKKYSVNSLKTTICICNKISILQYQFRKCVWSIYCLETSIDTSNQNYFHPTRLYSKTSVGSWTQEFRDFILSFGFWCNLREIMLLKVQFFKSIELLKIL